MMDESEENVGRYFTINALEPQGSCRAELKIDLTEYLTANNQRHDSSDKALMFDESQRELLTPLSSLHAATLWRQMLNQATLGMEKNDVISLQKAPVSKILEKSFVEIVKNTLDEAIITERMRISLFMNIAFQMEKKQITINLYDNGRGFPDTLIKKLATKTGRDEYMDEKGSIKKEESLVGGAGKGLRQLMAMMDYGEEYTTFERYSEDEYDQPHKRKPRFERPKDTMLIIGTRPDHQPGAFISLTTSKQPWLAIETRLDDHEIDVVKSIVAKFDYNKVRARFWSASESATDKEKDNTLLERHSI